VCRTTSDGGYISGLIEVVRESTVRVTTKPHVGHRGTSRVFNIFLLVVHVVRVGWHLADTQRYRILTTRITRRVTTSGTNDKTIS
jgi:cystathionine beta-lyase family protein involved in aluminum resistance